MRNYHLSNYIHISLMLLILTALNSFTKFVSKISDYYKLIFLELRLNSKVELIKWLKLLFIH